MLLSHTQAENSFSVGDELLKRSNTKKMSKISVLLLFSVVKICSSDYVADSMGQFFLESSIHVDFASSFYNNLKFYFPDFDPEGIKLNSK